MRVWISYRKISYHTVHGIKQFPPGFWVITRDHGVGELSGSVEMNPTCLPELPKSSRTLVKSGKIKKLGKENSRRIPTTKFYWFPIFCIHRFKGGELFLLSTVWYGHNGLWQTPAAAAAAGWLIAGWWPLHLKHVPCICPHKPSDSVHKLR